MSSKSARLFSKRIEYSCYIVFFSSFNKQAEHELGKLAHSIAARLCFFSLSTPEEPPAAVFRLHRSQTPGGAFFAVRISRWNSSSGPFSRNLGRSDLVLVARIWYYSGSNTSSFPIGELKNLSPSAVSSSKHVPRINREIPFVDEATSDHQRLRER
uniref:Uncharacterized protein n=1 Tax=Ananas comosus var. bracteatus TaxID=296719 RepID=A0A6V7QAF0_ANACO|nr:unnamed protein product [Ananas comosus var. bracteatus]